MPTAKNPPSPESTFLPPSPPPQRPSKKNLGAFSFTEPDDKEPPTLQMGAELEMPLSVSKMTGSGPPLYSTDLNAPPLGASNSTDDETKKAAQVNAALSGQTAPLEPSPFVDDQGTSPLHGASELGEQSSPVYKRPWAIALIGLMVGFSLGVGSAFLLSTDETDPTSTNANGKIGEVLILTDDGATSFVDGQAVGSTYPIRLALPALKTHVLEVKRAGFNPVTQDISLEAGTTQIINIRFESASHIDSETHTTETGGDLP